MSKKPNKCPGCGLVNFREAAECQWCALALGGRARTELIDDAPAARKPWGLIAFALAAALLCGGFALQAVRKAAARAEQAAAEGAESPDAAKPGRRGESPSLDPLLNDNETSRMLENHNEMTRRAAERNREFRRAIEEHERAVYGAERDPLRAREAERLSTLPPVPPRMVATPPPPRDAPAPDPSDDAPEPPDDW